MKKKLTGRAIIHFAYHSKTHRHTYNSILLGLERANEKYSLPGGQFDPRKDKDTADTVIREVKEEYGLDVTNLRRAFNYSGHVCEHEIYVVDASGTLHLDRNELYSIGFLIGYSDNIPGERLESHVKALFTEYYGKTLHMYQGCLPIKIPGHYFAEWVAQRERYRTEPILRPRRRRR